MKWEHVLEKESWALALVLIFGIGILLGAYSVAGKFAGQVPIVGGDTLNIVPTTGDQGYPVLEFCQDAATVVTKSISPPDSTFAANYTLDRSKDGVHEVVDVGVYADPAKQPVATHYDSANVPRDADVTKDAMRCITSKVKP